MISYRQLSGADFVLQIAGDCISASLGYQNFIRGTCPCHSPYLGKALWALHIFYLVVMG